MSTYDQLRTTIEWRQWADKIKRLAAYGCAICKQVKPSPMLHVHHPFYDGRLPWQYDPIEVQVLCESCHGAMHEWLERFRKRVFSRLTPTSFRILCGALEAALTRTDPMQVAGAIASLCADQGAMQRFYGDFQRNLLPHRTEQGPTKAAALARETKKRI